MLGKCLEYFINFKGSGGFEAIDTFFLIYNLDTGHKGRKLFDQRIQNVEWIDCNDDEDYSDGTSYFDQNMYIITDTSTWELTGVDVSD